MTAQTQKAMESHTANPLDAVTAELETYEKGTPPRKAEGCSCCAEFAGPAKDCEE